MTTLKVVTLVVALAFTACAGGDDSRPADPTGPVDDPVITIADMEFQGGTVTVTEGTTVTWVWEDAPVEHNVVFDTFESPLQAEGSYTHTFEGEGTFEYYCEPHPFMTGTITVVAAEPG